MFSEGSYKHYQPDGENLIFNIDSSPNGKFSYKKQFWFIKYWTKSAAITHLSEY